MAIATPPTLTISAGSPEAPVFLASTSLDTTDNSKRKPRNSALTPEFDPQIFRTPEDFERIALFRTPLESLTQNELSRLGEFKVARVAMQTLGNAISEVEVVGWRGKNLEDGQRNIKIKFKDGSPVDQVEIEVKYGISHDGQRLQRFYMRTFRDAVPEAERYTREGRNKAMWRKGIMLINGARPDVDIAASIQSQLAEIEKLAPVVVFEA